MIRLHVRRACSVAAVAALALVLSGCFLSPGKFASRLDIRQDRTFTYTYEGEIYLLALSQLAAMNERAQQSESDASTVPACYTDEGDERECTPEEIAADEQMREEIEEARAASQAQEAEAMRAMLGGIDPADPEAAEEIAKRLKQQKGWERVVYKGDGLFDVSFRISGGLDHDFLFPTLERFPSVNYFLQVALRDDGSVRVDAPGFSPQSGGGPFQSLMGGMSGAFSTTGNAQEDLPNYPKIDGIFTLVTDGEILANNTDRGPRQGPAGRTLEWTITQRTLAAPMALIKLGD